MMYLGTLGRMIKIKCPTSLQDIHAGGFAFSTTLEGKVKAQSLPGGRRVWDVGLGQLTRPEDLHHLEQFTRRAWGSGPFIFVADDAAVTNLMSPSEAACDPGVLSSSAVSDGPLLTPDGWAARSIRPAGAGAMYFGTDLVPVIPGQPVTVSAYVLGAGARVRMVWYDAAGSPLGTFTSTVLGNAASAVRSWRTALPVEGAVSVRVVVLDAAQAAWPAITWTDKLLPHSPGHGCPQAVVHGASKDVVRSTNDQQLYSTGFTVTEVG